MATLSTGIIELSNILGASPRTFVSMARWLRPAGLIPRGKTGIGDGGDPEIGADTLTNLLLASVSSAVGQPARNVVHNVRELSEVHLKTITAAITSVKGVASQEDQTVGIHPQVPQSLSEWFATEISNARVGASSIPGFKFAYGHIEICEKYGITMRITYVDATADLSEPHRELWLNYFRMANPSTKPFGFATTFKFNAVLIDQLAAILGEPAKKPTAPLSVAIRTAAFGRV